MAPSNLPNHTLLNLPGEIRNAILECIFDDDILNEGFIRNERGNLLLDRSYRCTEQLKPFTACKQLYSEGNALARNKTNFILRCPTRHVRVPMDQITTIRHVSFVATQSHFHELVRLSSEQSGISSLHLDTLTFILRSPGVEHYLFDFTTGVTSLLRVLHNVKRLVFVRNGANVKGGFRTWYNRLVGLIMKVDHYNRYDRVPTQPEEVWWAWKFDPVAETICLEAQPVKPLMGEEAYMQMIRPLMEELKKSIEVEEPQLNAFDRRPIRWY